MNLLVINILQENNNKIKKKTLMYLNKNKYSGFTLKLDINI